MLRFDQRELEFTGSGGHLALYFNQGKDRRWKISWRFAGRARCLSGGLPRGDLCGVEYLELWLSTADFTGEHWHELSGQAAERTENWDITKTVMLCPRATAESPRDPTDERFAMSLCHHFKLGARRGYYFSLEGSASFLPSSEAGQVVFGGTDATGDELNTVMQELEILEYLPLSTVVVATPMNAPDRVAYARQIAASVGLDELEPWPGSQPDFQPLGKGPKETQDTNSHIYLVTPWARDTTA